MDIDGNEDIAWYNGDHALVDMSYGHFGMGLGNVINDILIPNNETVLMLLEGYDEVFEIQFHWWEQGCCGGLHIRELPRTKWRRSSCSGSRSNCFYKMGFNSGNMLEGLYNAEMMINSNDLLNPEIMVNISMDVTGFAELHVDQSALDFESYFW